MELPLIFEKLGISLGLGLLVGLQRERVGAVPAGIRTFALTSLLGTLCALLARETGHWMVAAGMIALAGLFIVAQVSRNEEEEHPGLTTEVAALVMYGVGAYLVYGPLEVALAVGGGVALLLHLKTPMHQLAVRIGEDDLRSIFQLVLLALVILPVLPNQTYGPYEVFNPYQTWRLVVLIVGLGLAGYLLTKLIGPEKGALVNGLLGGTVSSTAATVNAARQARTSPATVRLASLVILLASTVAGARLLIEAAVAAPSAVSVLLPPLAVSLVWLSAVCAVAWYFGREEGIEPAEPQNPARLRVALLFGVAYTLVLLAVAATREHLGVQALYGVALLSGLVDIDAITLSAGSLVQTGHVEAATGWRVMLVGFLSNLVFKAGIAGSLGGKRLFQRVALLFGLGALGLLGVMLFWPD